MLHRILSVIALVLLVSACNGTPTHPTTLGASPAAVAVTEATGTTSGLADDPTTAFACKPTFERGATINNQFFPLTIKVPSHCGWFARNNERGTVAWWLTENSPDYKTRRYNFGVWGIGTQTVGVFYRGGWDEEHVLDVCLGTTSCDRDDEKVAQYRFTYSR